MMTFFVTFACKCSFLVCYLTLFWQLLQSTWCQMSFFYSTHLGPVSKTEIEIVMSGESRISIFIALVFNMGFVMLACVTVIIVDKWTN